MNIHDAMPNPMIKGHDLKQAGGEKTYTIARVAVETNFVGRGAKKTQAVVYFHRETKKLALNKTNMEAIASLYGEETEDWIGQPITLHTTPMYDDINKRDMDAVRVKTKGLPPRNPNAPTNQRNPNQPRPTAPPAPPPPKHQPFPTIATKDMPAQPPELPRQPSVAEQMRDAKRAAWNKWIDRTYPIEAAEPPTKEQLDEMANKLKEHVQATFAKDLGQLTIDNYLALAESDFTRIELQPSPISDEPQVNADDIPF